MPEETQASVPAAPVRRDEVPLSSAQARYLTSEAGFGALAKLAFRVALAIPLILFGLCMALTRVVSRVPLIGWLFAICGVVVTVLSIVVGLVAVPIVALILLPVVLLGRRSKLRQDLARSNALRQAGTFQVSETVAGGGALLSELKKFRLSKEELEGLKPALVSTEQGTVLTGSVVHAINSGDLLAAFDESGRQLIGVTA